MINRSATSFVGGNYFDKYRSRNPIHRWLMHGFLSSVRNLLSEIEFESVLEVGCGPGDLASQIVPPNAKYLGIDIDSKEIGEGRRRYPNLSFQVASAYQLPVESSSVDLILACEVLEHLEAPETALEEIDRATKEWVLVSVPSEPVWRILNMMRGKYWTHLGNTPGHIQHFRRSELSKILKKRFRIHSVRNPLPWTIALCSKKN
jgi:ubiquinone/menaquinone biosynthesis C-methylase UbiE